MKTAAGADRRAEAGSDRTDAVRPHMAAGSPVLAAAGRYTALPAVAAAAAVLDGGRLLPAGLAGVAAAVVMLVAWSKRDDAEGALRRLTVGLTAAGAVWALLPLPAAGRTVAAVAAAAVLVGCVELGRTLRAQPAGSVPSAAAVSLQAAAASAAAVVHTLLAASYPQVGGMYATAAVVAAAVAFAALNLPEEHGRG